MRRLPPILMVGFALVLLLCLTAPAAAGEIKGKVVSVSPEKYEFVIEGNKEMITFHMDEDAQVMIDNTRRELADLMPGDNVTVVARQEGEHMMAIEVRCRRK